MKGKFNVTQNIKFVLYANALNLDKAKILLFDRVRFNSKLNNKVLDLSQLKACILLIASQIWLK